jgi:hypothetical protein
VIDQGLVTVANRQLVTCEEVRDLLLDLRAVLTVAERELVETMQSPAA